MLNNLTLASDLRYSLILIFKCINIYLACDYYYNVTEVAQFFSSPNYPRRSPHNYKCNFHLTAPLSNQRIQLTVVEFDTESCCDFVTVRKTITEVNCNVT